MLIFGRSGSGKSTVLGMLAGLIRPTTGTIQVSGLDIAGLSDDKISELRAKEIGFVFQFSELIPTLTVLENILVPTLFFRDRDVSRQSALDLITKTGLSDRADAYPELFRQLNEEGKTIVMVTHNPDLVPYGTRAYQMEKGKLVARNEFIR